MSERSVEATGPDVEAAIEAGLEQLGVGRKDVIVEIVEEGRKGILGVGGKEATVRLTPLPTPDAPQVPPQRERESEAEKPPTPATEVDTEASDVEAPAAAETAPPRPETAEEDVDDVEVASDIVRTLIDKMGFEEATVSVTQSEPDERTGRVMNVVHVQGDDLASLIGPRGETLNDLQYLARLMAGHALRRRADFLVDVDNYRGRRKEALTSLAQRMAQKAIDRGEPVTLEPMNAYDRRLVHIALRDRDDVYTNSVGEGSQRRVRIFLQD